MKESEQGKDRHESDGRPHHLAADPGPIQPRLKQSGHKGRADPAQSETGQSDAELRRREVGLRVLQHFAHASPVAAPTEIILLVPAAGAKLHHGKLGRDKECVQQQERHHSQQAQAGTIGHLRQSGSQGLEMGEIHYRIDHADQRTDGASAPARDRQHRRHRAVPHGTPATSLLWSHPGSNPHRPARGK